MTGAVTKVRNRGQVPNLSREGELVKPFPIVGNPAKGTYWYRGLKPWERVHYHQTMASVRRYYGFRSKVAVADDLDFILSSTYQHSTETFADKCDIYIQPETTGVQTWRCLKNIKDLKADRPVAQLEAVGTKDMRYLKSFKELDDQEPDLWKHPIPSGGIKEKVHPFSVKLMNSSHHSPQTNAGYIRQDRDGSVFMY